MKILFATILLILSAFITKSQPTLLWEAKQSIKKSPNPGSVSFLPKLRFDPNNNIIVTSIKPDAGGFNDLIILKYNSNGKFQWDFVYGGEMLLNDFETDLAIDSQENIIVTGVSYTKMESDFDLFYAEFDQFIIKISPAGELIWKIKQPMMRENWPEKPQIVIDQRDNLYLLENMHNLNSSLLKLKPNGEELWRYDFSNDYNSQKLLQIRNNKITTIENVSYDTTRITHFNFDGKVLTEHDIAHGFGGNIVLDDNANFYSIFTNKFKVSRLDLMGNILWSFEKPTNLPRGHIGDIVKDLVIDNNESVYITGKFYKDNDEIPFKDSLILTVKLDSEGNVVWEHTRDNDGDSFEIGLDLAVTDYGVVVTGKSEINDSIMTEVLYFIDKNHGNTIWHIGNNRNYIYNYYNATTVLYNNELYTTDLDYDKENNIYTHIKKYSNPALAITAIDNSTTEYIDPIIYPNPASYEINIVLPKSISKFNLDIINSRGQKLMEIKEITDKVISLPLNLKKGIYFFRILSNHSYFSKKIIIE